MTFKKGDRVRHKKHDLIGTIEDFNSFGEIKLSGAVLNYNPDDFEKVEEQKITKEQAWNKIAERFPNSAHELSIMFEHFMDLKNAGFEFGQREKVKVPKNFHEYFIRELFELENSGEQLHRIFYQLFNSSISKELNYWLDENAETAVRAILEGYEVEQEPLYEVVLFKNDNGRRMLVKFSESRYTIKWDTENFGYWKQKLTKDEIEEASALHGVDYMKVAKRVAEPDFYYDLCEVSFLKSEDEEEEE
ncbi:DUF1642 domain-containing protein [Listeria kieliensis]